MGIRLVIDRIGGEAYRDVQKCTWGRGYLRVADVSSFWTLADRVVGQMIRCINNGRILLVNVFPCNTAAVAASDSPCSSALLGPGTSVILDTAIVRQVPWRERQLQLIQGREIHLVVFHEVA